MNGLFITIEGPDGAGKTSVLNELYPRLQLTAKRSIVKTREPGGIPIAEKIRHVILDPSNDRMDDRSRESLFLRIVDTLSRLFPIMRGVNYETYFSDRSRQRLKPFGQ